MAFSIDFKFLRYSIVNTKETTETKKDSSEPYSFVDFVKNLDVDNITDDFIIESFNKYLIEWTKIKNQTEVDFQTIRKEKYTTLLKNIEINFLTQDEQRILGNINYDDPLELDVAIPFFVEKIKDLIEYYTRKRRDVKRSKSKWSTKGSKEFIEGVISEYITDNYIKTPNTFQREKQNYQELSSFQANYGLTYDGLYDLNDYRNVEFIFDPKFLLSSEEDFDLSSLPLSAFSDYYPSFENLNENLKRDLYKKYISSDQKYYKNGSIYDLESTTPFFDPYNYSTPFISRIADTTNLLRDKDIGFYFTSKYIYTSNYFSPFGISLQNTEELDGVFPKLDTYYSDQYKDYYFWSKYSSANEGMWNKPIRRRRLKRFYGYQSRDMNLADSSGGIEKYTDDIQIWGGDKNETWLNEDVFDKFTDNILNRDSKTDFFFHLGENESVYKYCCDIYGNEYYLIKKQKPITTTQTSIYTLNTFSGQDSDANSFLLGQRVSSTKSLDAIQIQNEVALGFFINISQDIIESYSDFNIEQLNYEFLDSGNFNTITLSSEVFDDKKSIYEKYYEGGKLYIKTASSDKVKQFSYFSSDVFNNSTLYSEMDDSIINIDIVGDFIIFTTSSTIVTSKIKYDYSTSTLTFDEITKNVFDFNNKPLEKTIYYWNDTKTNTIIGGDVVATDNTIIPTLYQIDIENNTKQNFVIDHKGENYTQNNVITFENISRPCIIKQKENIYLLTLIKDICENYYYNLIKYKIVSGVNIELVYNNFYSENILKLTNDVGDDFTSSQSLLSSYIDTVKNNIGKLVYWNNELSSIDFELLSSDVPYIFTEESSYYDNDRKTIVTDEKPTFEYRLSDLVKDTLVETISSTSEETYNFENPPTILKPSNILLDFREIKDFVNMVDRTEPIYKIEYFMGGKIITQNILNINDAVTMDQDLFEVVDDSKILAARNLSSDSLSSISEDDSYSGSIALTDGAEITITGEYYNNTFIISPINTKYLTHNNRDGDTITIIFYSANGKKITFNFAFPSQQTNLDDIFSKIELLDIRIKETQDGNNSMIIVNNTRNPDFITTSSLINI